MTRDQLPGTEDPTFAALSDLQLVERIIALRQDRKRIAGALRDATSELADRVLKTEHAEIVTDDLLIQAGPKCVTDYDQTTLASLRQCTTEDQIFSVVKQVPSGKQLKAISQLAGASAKAVIASATRRIETDTMTVKIKKRPKRRRGRR